MPEPPKKRFPRKLLLLILVIPFVLAGVFAFLILTSPKFKKAVDQLTEPNGTKAILKRVGGSEKCEGSGPVQLTALPMKKEDFGIVIPYGAMVGAHVTPIDHMYFAPAARDSKRDAYPVYAMADGILSEITSRGLNVDTGEKRPVEYRLVITHTCTFLTYYDLVTSMDQSILDAAPDLVRKGSAHPEIKVKKGQLLGRIGAQTLDFAIWDLEKPLSGFANPESYQTGDPWKLYTADPLDYVTEEIKEILLERNPRTLEPLLGKIDYDIDGKMVGNWFREGTNGYAGLKQQEYWRDHLSLVYNHYDPTSVEVSIGDWSGDEVQFAVVGNSPDPAKLGVESSPTKYELLQRGYKDPSGKFWDNFSLVKGLKVAPMAEVKGTILLQLLETRKLKVETFPGKKASQVTSFTSSAKIFVR
jgi:hypothetical protein